MAPLLWGIPERPLDELRLPYHITHIQPLDLPLAPHIHCLDALDRSLRGVERAITQCCPLLNESLILLNYIIEVFYSAKFPVLRQHSRAGLLSPVYHGEHGTRDLKELVRSYEYLVGDSTRVMNWIKALYRSRAISCAGTKVYKPRRREEWLAKLPGLGVRALAERLYSELDHLASPRREARRALVAKCHRHPASKVLLKVPTLGIVRIAQLIAAIITPHRFRTKRQFWFYCGLAVMTESSADHEVRGWAAPQAEVASYARLN